MSIETTETPIMPDVTDMSTEEKLNEIVLSLREIRAVVANVAGQVMPTIDALKDSTIGKMLF